MLHKLREKIIHLSFVLALFAALSLLGAPAAYAQGESPTGPDSSAIARNNAPAVINKGQSAPAAINKGQSAPAALTPVLTNYKGVTIGMSADEVRQKLGNLKENGKVQDFFVFSDSESAQVYYDDEGKVMAVSLNYVGEQSGAPDAKAVLGSDLEAKADGSMHKLVRYPEAGYWVSYSRTAGDPPLITITMQKMN